MKLLMYGGKPLALVTVVSDRYGGPTEGENLGLICEAISPDDGDCTPVDVSDEEAAAIIAGTMPLESLRLRLPTEEL